MKMKFNKYLYLIEETKYKIYVDMDGVLTDFEQSFKNLTGINKDPRKYEDEVGSEKFWDIVKKGGLDFWSKMPWMGDGRKLWNYVKDKDVYILSAPAKTIPDSPKGKKIWVKKELGNVELFLKRASEKQMYAAKDSILIDDYDKNISQWKSAGGIGIFHKSADQTIKKLKELGV